jgi:hypothetical protein
MDVCEYTPRDVLVAEDTTVACHLYYDHEATSSEGAEDEGTDATDWKGGPGAKDDERAAGADARDGSGTTDTAEAVRTEEDT